MPINEGVLVSAPIRPLSPEDTYPTALANEIQGGCHSKSSSEDLTNISPERIVDNMLATTRNNIYQRNEDSAHWNNLVTNYIYEQNEPLSIWIINHNLNRYPEIIIINSVGHLVECDIRYIDLNIIEIYSNIPFIGKVQLR